MYYLYSVDKWITIDADHRIHFWNLEQELASNTIQCDEFAIGGIIDVIEIDHL